MVWRLRQVVADSRARNPAMTDLQRALSVAIESIADPAALADLDAKRFTPAARQRGRGFSAPARSGSLPAGIWPRWISLWSRSKPDKRSTEDRRFVVRGR